MNEPRTSTPMNSITKMSAGKSINTGQNATNRQNDAENTGGRFSGANQNLANTNVTLDGLG